MSCLVGEHRLPHHIANGKDVRHVCPHLLVHGDEAASIHLDPCGRRFEPPAVRHATHRDQHLVIDLRLRRTLALEGNAQAFRQGLDGHNLRARQNGFVAGLQALLQGPHEIAVGTRHQTRPEFDHGHLRTQGVVNAGHFQSDDAATDDEQTPINTGQFQRTGAIENARVHGESRQFHRLATRRNDALVKTDDLATAIFGGNRQTMCGEKSSRPPQHLHLALLRETCQAGSQLADHAVLPALQLDVVDDGRRKLHPQRGHVMRLFNDLCRVQQGLRGDAANIQTDTAQRGPTFHQTHFQPKVCGTKCGRVPAGAGAKHQQRNMQICRGFIGGGNHHCITAGRWRTACRCGSTNYCHANGRCHAGNCSDGRITHGRSNGNLTGRCSFRGWLRRDDTRHQRPRAHLGTHLNEQGFHGSRERRRHIHGRLFAFQREQRVFFLHHIAGFHQYGDDRYVFATPQVRHPYLLRAQGTASSKPATFASSAANAVVKRAPSAPSMTRWS